MLSPIDEIKNRLDIVDVIQGYIKLTKAGVNYKALCPFHHEKTPSFVVSPEKQIWHCFGCGKGGDIFRFVMEIENVDFKEALKILAQKAGVTLKPESPKLRSQRDKLFDINEKAARFFQENLLSDAGKDARDYLKKRGINDKTIRDFRLGYALNDWRALKENLLSQGFQEEDMVAAGVVIKPNREQKANSSYDRFRNRIIFPIRDFSDRVVGFSGRILPDKAGSEEKKAKYINSPNTLIYNKSRTLYGLSQAREAIRKNKFIILVEGNIDVLMSHQIGIKNVIATCGTALNENHLVIIKRYVNHLKLCFDQDTAGELATKEAIKKALALDLSIKIVVFSENKDPADLILDRPQSWHELVKGGKEILEYLFDKTFKNYPDKTVSAKKAIAKELLPFIKAIANKIEQAYWINQLAEKLSVEEKYLYEALSKTKTGITSSLKAVSSKRDNKNSIAQDRRRILEENLLMVLLKYPGVLKDKKHQLIKNELFSYSDLRKAFNAFCKSPTKKTIVRNETLSYLSLKADFLKLFTDINEKEANIEIGKIIGEIKVEDKRDQQLDLINKIKRAEKRNNKKLLKKLITQLQKVAQKI